MEIEKAIEMKKVMENHLFELIQAFEETTGMEVEEIDWRRDNMLSKSTLKEIMIGVRLK